MATRDRRVDRGSRQGRYLLRVLGQEIRDARLAAGLSQRAVGAAAGVSGPHVARLERAGLEGASVMVLARVFAVLGMRLGARPYPDGPALRDIGQARLLSRFQAQLHPVIGMRTEVPLRDARDPRAWDAELVLGSEICKVEAVTALADLQAIDRRFALKMADDRADTVILVVADTHRNRRVLREFRELIRARYPLDTRAVMAALRAGRLPEASGIVVL